MTNRLLIPVIALALFLPLLPAGADTVSPGTALEDLVQRVTAKIKAGEREEGAFVDELAEFDALLAKYADQKTDEVAQIAVMKALLYIQVFEEGEKAIPIFQMLKSEFPGTSAADKADSVIAQIQRDSRLSIGRPFPSFAVEGIDGESLSLDDYRGKVVLVDFWATWCGPCVGELPNVLATYRDHHEAGFDIVGISLDSNESKLKAFIRENDMPWRQYFDGKGWQNELAQEYGINSIPSTFLLDADGVIIGKNLRGHALGEAVAAALDK